MGIVSPLDLIDEAIECYKTDLVLAPLRKAVKAASTWQERLTAIRTLHREQERVDADFAGIDPYSLGLHELMTPIELSLWQDIRSTNRLRFLPQYPAGRFVVDFGDPVRKIAIEADGKAFHDKARDRARDQELFDVHGWRVFRVTGAETKRVSPSPAEFIADHIDRTGERPDSIAIDDAAAAYYLRTSAGVVRAIRDVIVDGTDLSASDWRVQSLQEHRLAAFPVCA